MPILEYGRRSLQQPLPWRLLPAAALGGAAIGGVAACEWFDRLLWLLAGCQQIAFTDIGQPLEVQMHLLVALAASAAVVACCGTLWGPSAWRVLAVLLICGALFVGGVVISILAIRPFATIGGMVPANAIGVALAPAIGCVAVLTGTSVALLGARFFAARRPAM